jgi:hypothetical protein
MPKPDLARFAHKRANWEIRAEHFNNTRVHRNVHANMYEHEGTFLAFLTVKPEYSLLGFGVGKTPDDAWTDCEASVDPQYLTPLPISEHEIKCGGQAVIVEGE